MVMPRNADSRMYKIFNPKITMWSKGNGSLGPNIWSKQGKVWVDFKGIQQHLKDLKEKDGPVGKMIMEQYIEDECYVQTFDEVEQHSVAEMLNKV